jgi:acetoin utilization deacetylase AcuC-like enzyme
MLKIGYNNSENHVIIERHFENPKRSVETICHLKSVIDNKYFMIPSIIDIELAISLMKTIHSKFYIEKLKNMDANNHYCKYCSSECNEIKFTKCFKCNEIITLENMYIKWDRDTYQTNESFDIICEAICIIKDTLDSILSHQTKYGYLILRPPSHHAGISNAHGFCLVNSTMIAAKYAQTIGFEKVLIFDYDAHANNGCVEIINTTTNIYSCSINCLGIFPFTGDIDENTDYILNIPLFPGSNTDKYNKVFTEKVLPFINNVNPNIIIISNGFDAHKDDPMKIMKVDDSFYINVAEQLKLLNIPLVYILEGGYNVFVCKQLSEQIIKILI